MKSSREQVARVLREASEAEANGQNALAGLLALHALQIDSNSAEARAIFDRSQAALGRTGGEDPEPITADQPPMPGSGSEPVSAPRMQSVPEILQAHPPSPPYDLSYVPPLTPKPAQRGIGFRLIRTAFPLVGLALLLAGLWLNFGRFQGSAPVAAEPVAADPATPIQRTDAGPNPAPSPPPGTVALNVVPWARVDAIYSVGDGRVIQPEGLVSPCTISLPPGDYRFGVSHPDFGSVELPVKVESGQTSKVEHSLISSQELESQLLSSATDSVKGAGEQDRATDSQPEGAGDGNLLSGRSETSADLKIGAGASVRLRD
ncbi:MAG: hypothetical protein EHM61_06680 [Acidobacteria bacterium]|nr:MAG: hypothetical protein EHM61_06680 [Acidobacteriota bacterium]